MVFGYNQSLEDPRDGLTIFGPLDNGKPYGIRVGVIGTKRGIGYYCDWAKRIQQPLSDEGSSVARPPFPGFATAFRIPWSPEPVQSVEVPEAEILRTVNIDDRHQRVHATVGLYSERILYALRTEETAPDVWFVVIPDVVYENCRPRSRVSSQVQVHADYRLVPRKAQRTRTEPMLFEQMNREAEPYYYEVDFHNQLKARLLSSLALTQIVRESTISPDQWDPG